MVEECARRMHEIYFSGHLPAIERGKYCEKCSLNNICMPESIDCSKVSHYLKKNLYEETA